MFKFFTRKKHKQTDKEKLLLLLHEFNIPEDNITVRTFENSGENTIVLTNTYWDTIEFQFTRQGKFRSIS